MPKSSDHLTDQTPNQQTQSQKTQNLLCLVMCAWSSVNWSDLCLGRRHGSDNLSFSHFFKVRHRTLSSQWPVTAPLHSHAGWQDIWIKFLCSTGSVHLNAPSSLTIVTYRIKVNNFLHNNFLSKVPWLGWDHDISKTRAMTWQECDKTSRLCDKTSLFNLFTF